MSKAKLILELYAQLLGTMPENKLPMAVAERIGTTDSYVRTVARQRMGRGSSEAERRYLRSSLGRLKQQRQKKAWWVRVKSDPQKLTAFYEHRNKYRRRKRAEANQLA